MDDFTKDFIRKAYVDAMTLYGPEYLIEALEKEGINNKDPEVVAFLKELDIEFGIY